jgi:sigma-E factor negative regulatory protein RseA
MNEELDSQLSAMFDDELPAAECELLARRLSRDEQLKARWGRYAVVGAAIRAERGVRLNAPLAGRVSAVLITEPALSEAPPAARSRLQWWQPLAGVALAASVAAASILWLRGTAPGTLSTSAPLAAVLPAVAPASRASAVPESYVVPPVQSAPLAAVPSTELANYVVAHSMFSSPVARRNLLSSFVTSEPGTTLVEEPQEDAKVDAR